MDIDLEKLSHDELQQLISDAQKALKSVDARRRAEAKRAAEKKRREEERDALTTDRSYLQTSTHRSRQSAQRK